VNKFFRAAAQNAPLFCFCGKNFENFFAPGIQEKEKLFPLKIIRNNL
jgi:hypothetical protein